MFGAKPSPNVDRWAGLLTDSSVVAHQRRYRPRQASTGADRAAPTGPTGPARKNCKQLALPRVRQPKCMHAAQARRTPSTRAPRPGRHARAGCPARVTAISAGSGNPDRQGEIAAQMPIICVNYASPQENSELPGARSIPNPRGLSNGGGAAVSAAQRCTPDPITQPLPRRQIKILAFCARHSKLAVDI